MWTLQNIWNETLVNERREVTARDHIHASEIGKNHWERYQKMIGTPFTNEFEERILRKFSAGLFFEQMIGHVLQKIGILYSAQRRIEIPETADTLKVTGYADYEAGGITDWTEAEKRVREAGFPEAILNICLSLIQYFKKEYPAGLTKQLYEIKSVNSQVFWAKKDYLQEAYPWHVFQIYTYMKQLGYEQGTILYISKDDLTVKEINVYKSDALEKSWQDDVKKMTEYYRGGKIPPLPETCVWDERQKLRFSAKRELEEAGTEAELHNILQKNKLGEMRSGYKIIHNGCADANWEIEFSPYRYLIAGVKNEEQYEKWYEGVKEQVSERNKKAKLEIINFLKNATTK